CCNVLIKINETKNDLMFDYKELNELARKNNENSEAINFDNIENEKYEEVEDSNNA
ncbi:25050_t:CDS:1, partial [Cetraspora pellucida]